MSVKETFTNKQKERIDKKRKTYEISLDNHLCDPWNSSINQINKSLFDIRNDLIRIIEDDTVSEQIC